MLELASFARTFHFLGLLRTNLAAGALYVPAFTALMVAAAESLSATADSS